MEENPLCSRAWVTNFKPVVPWRTEMAPSWGESGLCSCHFPREPHSGAAGQSGPLYQLSTVQSPSTLEAAHRGHRRGAALGLMGRETGNWGRGHTIWEASGTDRAECCSATCCITWASWDAPGSAPSLNTGTQPGRQPQRHPSPWKAENTRDTA